MAFDFDVNSRAEALAFLATTFPVSSIIEIRSGSAPGVANAATGTLLVSFTLGASPWAAAGTAGDIASRSLASLPLTATASGGAPTNAGHFRLKNAGDTRRVEGTVTVTGGGGDMTIDNISINTGQSVNITGFTVGQTDNAP